MGSRKTGPNQGGRWGMAEQPIDEWFMQEVLPLEPMLTRFLQRNWRGEAEIDDLGKKPMRASMRRRAGNGRRWLSRSCSRSRAT